MLLFIYFGSRNLIDGANIAALAALMTFRRPECSLGGEDGQEVIMHPPEVSSANLLELVLEVPLQKTLNLIIKYSTYKYGKHIMNFETNHPFGQKSSCLD